MGAEALALCLGLTALSPQHYEERHMVERHGRDAGGPRKEWHSPPAQGPGYHDSRRLGDSRAGAVLGQHSR